MKEENGQREIRTDRERKEMGIENILILYTPRYKSTRRISRVRDKQCPAHAGRGVG